MELWREFYSRGQRAKRTYSHVHLAVLCASGTRLAPTGVERRPAARVFDFTQNLLKKYKNEKK